MAAGEGAWISEPLAFRRSLRVGDRLELWTDRGAVSLPVVAVFRDYGTEQGVAMVPAGFLQRYMESLGVTSLAVEAPQGAAPEALAGRMREALAAHEGEQELVIVTQSSLRESSLDVFDRTFAVTGALRVLCLLVAFCGIYGALAALQLERGSEVGLLRTLGATPGRVVGLVLGQTALLGLLAGVLAVPLGLALAQVLVHVVNRGSFGWTLTESSLPYLPVVETVVLAVVAALLAGLHPALRFGRVRPVEVLRES
jgi:putative ABC transport system permease protein